MRPTPRTVRGVLAAALTGAALLATGPAVTIPAAEDGQRPGGVRVQIDNDHWPSGHVLAGDTPRDDHYPGAGG